MLVGCTGAAAPPSIAALTFDGAVWTYERSPTGKYRDQTVPVGTLPPNPWGLYEMHGNVDEWVQDCWHDSYAHGPTDGSAWLGGDGGDCSRRVLRGGSWTSHPRWVRSARRSPVASDYRYDGSGFRLAQDIEPN